MDWMVIGFANQRLQGKGREEVGIVNQKEI